MVKALITGAFLPVFCLTLNGQVQAQSGNSSMGLSKDSLRNQIVRATINRINTKHYSPRPLDNTFSADIWNAFLKELDPYHNIFLLEDIEELEKYKHSIDEDLKAGSTDAFNNIFALYSKRRQETADLVRSITGKPISYNAKDSVQTRRDNSPWPAGISEKEQIWKQLLQFYVLKNLPAGAGDHPASSVPDLETEKKAREKVAAWYAHYFEQSIDDKFYAYINCITLQTDPHSNYTGPGQMDKMKQALTGQYFGVGMELATQVPDIFIKRLIPGGSAIKSGLLKENDRILSVSDKSGKMVSSAGVNVNDIADLIRGPKGSSVRLIVQQPGEAERTVTIMRDEIRENGNKAKSAIIRENGKKIGYVYLPLFYIGNKEKGIAGAGADIAREVAKLRENEVEGIVMDLRGNPGGSLLEAVIMSSLFMNGGPVSILRSRDTVNVYKAPEVAERQFNGPLVVMVDESSASASEIFSAAIQDRSRGLVIGTATSFGKGTAQTSQSMGKMGDPEKGIPDMNFGSINLTLQKFYRINGASTQLKGVIPDIVLLNTMNPEKIREKDYPSALPWDTLAVNDYKKPSFNFNYPVVTGLAKQRVSSNAALLSLKELLSRIDNLRRLPVPLGIAEYRSYQQQLNALNQQLAEAIKLKPGNSLTIEPSILNSINPELQNQDEPGAEVYAKWLQDLKKDLFLSEAVRVIQDMIANPIKE